MVDVHQLQSAHLGMVDLLGREAKTVILGLVFLAKGMGHTFGTRVKNTQVTKQIVQI